MRTYAEALADCMALGMRRRDCEESLRDRMVGGVFCDGTVVLSESGARCVPRETIDRVAAARAASPLVRELEPASPPSTGAVVAVVVGVALLGWLLMRD